MTTSRVRRRLRQAVSALNGLGPYERARERLNELTPGTTRCAWPACREPMQHLPLPNGMQTATESRYGVLCHVHAVDVAIAVVQHQTDLERFRQHFDQMSDERAIRLERHRREDAQYEAEKAALRQDRDGFVYYLRVGERIKVGYSVDVKRRMKQYPPGCELLAVEPGDRDLERQRHRQFEGSRTDGREWFRPAPDLMELVDEIVQTHGEPKRFAHHYRRKVDPIRISRSA